MADLYLDFGTDLNFAPGGDLQTADGPTLTNQRLARRFFTTGQQREAGGSAGSRGGYIFHPGFGAGSRSSPRPSRASTRS